MNLIKEINPYIFRGYDIRGVYPTDINEDIAYTIGRSFGSKLIDLGHNDCIVARDNRSSSLSLTSCLIKGITESGIDVIDLGLVTTPMYYYACIKEGITRGVMVTASHNPKDENGFKFAFDDSGNACGKTIQDFYDHTIAGEFHTGNGQVKTLSIESDYQELMKKSLTFGPRRLKVVIDCGNGTTALFAKQIFELFPIELETLFATSDPDFPNHHPDPSVEDNLTALKEKVLEIKADIGLAFDGDGDRVGVIDNQGEFLPMDQYMIIFCRNLIPISENKRVLYDVKCSKTLPDVIKELGGTPLLSRVGNSYTKRYTKEWDCLFGGELSGHIYFRDKFLGFDSGIYAGLRLVELLSNTTSSLRDLLEGIPIMYHTPELKIKAGDDIKFQVVNNVLEYVKEKKYDYNDIDGVRVEFKDGWASIRASNTGPNLTVRVEASTEKRKEEIKKEFLEVIEHHLH